MIEKKVSEAIGEAKKMSFNDLKKAADVFFFDE